MSDRVLSCLNEHHRVVEGYVLIREVKVLLEVGHDFYHPRVGIRIWLGSANNKIPYSFELSHHVHTPDQAGPYHPSCTNFASEDEAIESAIEAVAVYLVSAIGSGHEPSDDWLVPNEDF